MEKESITLVVNFKDKAALMEWLRVWKAYKEKDIKVLSTIQETKSMVI